MNENHTIVYSKVASDKHLSRRKHAVDYVAPIQVKIGDQIIQVETYQQTEFDRARVDKWKMQN